MANSVPSGCEIVKTPFFAGTAFAIKQRLEIRKKEKIFLNIISSFYKYKDLDCSVFFLGIYYQILFVNIYYEQFY